MNGSADSTLARSKAHFEDEIDRRGPVSERRIHICVLRETRNSHWYKYQWGDGLFYIKILYMDPLYRGIHNTRSLHINLI